MEDKAALALLRKSAWTLLWVGVFLPFFLSFIDGLVVLLAWNSFLAEKFGTIGLAEGFGIALIGGMVSVHFRNEGKKSIEEDWEGLRAYLKWYVTLNICMVVLILVWSKIL